MAYGLVCNPKMEMASLKYVGEKAFDSRKQACWRNLLQHLHWARSSYSSNMSWSDFMVSPSVHWGTEKNKLNNTNWKKKSYPECCIIPFVSLIDWINWTNAKLPFYLRLWMPFLFICIVKVLCGFLGGKGTLWYYKQFFSFWLVMIATFVFTVNI